MFEDSLAIDKGGRRPLRARIVPLAISLVLHGALVYILLTATMTIKILPLGKNITNVMIVPPPSPPLPKIVGPAGGKTSGAATAEGGLGREAAGPPGPSAPPPPPMKSPPRTPPEGAPAAAPGLASQFERSLGSRFKPGGDSELKIVLGPPGAPAAPPPTAGAKGTLPDFYQYMPGGGVPGGRGLGPGTGRGGGGSGGGGQRAAMRIALKGYDLAPWAQKVIDAVQRVWVLPNVGRLPAETRIRLAVMIKKDGSLESMEILETCSLEILDQAVLRAIRESLPFPALPADFPGDILECVFEFTYAD